MKNHKYVYRKNLRKIREPLIHSVQDKVRKHFTFQYKFTGSIKYNMVTYIEEFNKGYDIDVDFYLNSNASDIEPEEIIKEIKNAIDYEKEDCYDYAENSTSVLTIKVKDKENSKIIHSVDFAIIKDENCQKKYIHLYKEKNEYVWKEKSHLNEVGDKICEIKKKLLWNNVRKLYLDKKNKDKNDKKSYSLFLETINEIWLSIKK